VPKPADPWTAIEALVASLKTRKATIRTSAIALRDETERRLGEYKAELETISTEIDNLEHALEFHRANDFQPALRALPAPVKMRQTPPIARSAEHPVEIVKDWARRHGGDLVMIALKDDLVARGRYSSRESAHQSILNALAQIGSGFTRVTPGVYRFHSIDGIAIKVIEEEAAS
jgi:hypothetical protein